MRGLHRRHLWIAALLAGGLSALALSWAMAAPQAEFLHIAMNLSQSPVRLSYYADIAVSPDGDRVAVVWPEAYQDGGSRPGSVLLRWASESTGSGWSAPITVFAGSDAARAVWAAVAVSGTNPYQAWVAYVVHKSDKSQQIHYRVCNLEVGGSCGSPSVIISTTPASGDVGFTMVDIALDRESNPHFAYAYYQTGEVGTVYYQGPNYVQEIVAAANARRPAIAWNNGAVHVVWEAVSSDKYFIFYRRRTETGWGPSFSLVGPLSYDFAPHNPSIAVFSNTVMVVWDMNYYCSSSPCTEFTLAYVRSTDNGGSWPTGGLHQLGGDEPNVYRSTSVAEEYTFDLRPSVGFMGDGKPVIVWHANDGTQESPDYNLYHARALTVPETAGSAIEWAEIERFGQSSWGQQASPVIVLHSPLSVLHVAYVWSGDGSTDWETFYDGNEYDRYSRVFLPIVMRNFPGGG